MAKYGSSAGWFLVGGYDMVPNKLQGIRYKIESLIEPSYGLGDSWEEHSPVGMCRAELSQDGAFFDTSTSAGYMHVLNSTTIGERTPSSTERVVCIGTAGNTAVNSFVGMKGEFEQDYEVLAQTGKLTRANASYVITGNVNHGTILRTHSAGETSVFRDNGAVTTGGGVAFFQVTQIDMAGSTGVQLRVSDATSSGGSFTYIATVDTTGIGAWRVATTDDTIERWLCSSLAWSGTSGGESITYFVGFARL